MGDLHLPSVNAGLNSITTVLLIIGWIAIKKKLVTFHRACMGAAFATSTLFLISYLTHHYLHGSTKFPGTGPLRTVYFSILISHTILAAAIVPMVLVTLYKALRAQYAGHRRIARWTWPVWIYVSITGVVIYWMLYKSPSPTGKKPMTFEIGQTKSKDLPIKDSE